MDLSNLGPVPEGSIILVRTAVEYEDVEADATFNVLRPVVGHDRFVLWWARLGDEVSYVDPEVWADGLRRLGWSVEAP